MGRRFFLTAVLASLLASAGCLRNICERNGYYPVAPVAAAPNCCVPCCPPCAPAAAGYVAPAASAPAWNQPAAVPASGGCCCPCPPPPH